MPTWSDPTSRWSDPNVTWGGRDRICTRTELRVYGPAGTGPRLATIPASNVSFTKGVGGSGFLSASMDVDVADMFYGNYIRTNSSFDAGVAGWAGNTIYGTQTLPTSITAATWTGFPRLKATWPTTSLGSNVLTTVELIRGRTYSASANVYVPAGSPDVRMVVPFYDVGGEYLTTKDQWTRISVDFTAPTTGTIFVGVAVAAATNGQVCYVDDVMVAERAAAQSYTPKAPTPLAAILADCVIKVAIPLEDGAPASEVAAYAVRSANGTLWSGPGARSREISSAPSLWTAWSQDAVLYPESNRIQKASGESRTFGYQSSTYDPDADTAYSWEAPSSSAGRQDATTGSRANQPTAWPSSLGAAKWISRGSTNNGTRHVFVADVTVAADDYVKVWFSSDESARVYFAGEQIIETSSSETGYKEMSTWSAFVAAGTYRVAIDKTSVADRAGGDGVDPVLLAVATVDGTDAIVSTLRITDTTNWVCFTMDPDTGTPPGLTHGQILRQLHTEAAARGVTTWAALTPTFDGVTDSTGVAWADREERTWRVAFDSYGAIVDGLTDAGVSVDITPTLQLTAHTGTGVDRSWPTYAYNEAALGYDAGVGYSGSGGVVIEAEVNADVIRERGAPVACTVMPVQTQEGWVVVEDATAKATHGRREQALSLGSAPTVAQGRWVGTRALIALSRPSSEWSIEFYAVPGCVPFLDFFPGDIVAVRIEGVNTPRVILDLGAEAASTEGLIRWTASTGAPALGVHRSFASMSQRLARSVAFTPGQMAGRVGSALPVTRPLFTRVGQAG